MEENKLSELKEFIHKAPIGQYLGLRGCETLAKSVSAEKTLKNDEYLYRGGDKSDCFFMVASGRLALCMEDPKINRNRIIHVIEAGDLVGELSFVTEDAHKISVQSIGQSSVYVFGRKEINELYEKCPEVMFDFLKAVIKRIYTTTTSVNQQREELAAYLATGGRTKL
ncbi:cyclic nucleotide-binding domain-containing protein [Candidatus Haliotispira prima]|uniref:Cyclic nucleotide-binding domain-containing protein n=1 Tax=Candidatus Haliotispira prima TaxID=3034016 RepID=A0ABY8MHS3_9SPIO|nr:cyclic nucleotide-binding domain-containing protein [Candidatus Haliotispira prima]